MFNSWLTAEITCEGRIIRPSLDVAALADKDLPDACLRMHLILESIEFARCEGRWINREIFDPIDTLYSQLLHNEEIALSDWQAFIERFGEYYQLRGKKTIEVSAHSVNEMSSMAERLGVSLIG
ncbi:hypothetical protein [Bremerella sp.]|uniref:hypothetical protein n=1 Tax=Bremerella sp. TaxID=2795602 RepID=UPI00391ABE98